MKPPQQAPASPELRGPSQERKSFKPTGDKGKLDPEIRRSVAAYTLAQYSYLQNDPQKTAAYLEKVVKKGRWRSRISNHRLSVMQDWVRAHGQSISESAYRPVQRVETSTSRTIGTVLTWGIYGGAVFLFLIFLMFSNFRTPSRREDIQEH